MKKNRVSKRRWTSLVLATAFYLLNSDAAVNDRFPIRLNGGEHYSGEKANLKRIEALTGERAINDTRDAPGLSGPALYALHKELRALYDINTAPSRREMEIWKTIRAPAPHAKRVTTKSSWSDRGTGQSVLQKLMLFEDVLSQEETRQYIDLLVRLSDELYDCCVAQVKGADGKVHPLKASIAVYQDENKELVYNRSEVVPSKIDKKGKPVKESGTKTINISYHDYQKMNKNPVIAMVDGKLAEPEWSWLGGGLLWRVLSQTSIWIFEHPEYHQLKVEQPDHGIDYTGETYLEKAAFWTQMAVNAMSYTLSQTDIDADGSLITHAVNRSGHVAVNRQMSYFHGLMSTAHAAKLLNPEKYGSFHKKASAVVINGFNAFKKYTNCDMAEKRRGLGLEPLSLKNKYGPMYVWPYHYDSGTSEDMAHLGMDMGPMTSLTRYANVLTPAEWKAVANGVMDSVYNYDRNTVNMGMFRKEQPVGIFPYRVSGPRFGNVIGKYMPSEAYLKFSGKLLELWDGLLLEEKFGTNHTIRYYDDLLEARLYRFDGKSGFARFP